jgi:hypothetical protein
VPPRRIPVTAARTCLRVRAVRTNTRRALLV